MTDTIIGFGQKIDANTQRFSTIEADIDGLKTTVGEIQNNGSGGISSTVSKIEQRVDKIDLEVKGVEKKYSDDTQLIKMREDFNEVLLSLQATLGLFSSDMNTYMEDSSLSTDEKNNIISYKTSLEQKRVELNNQLNVVVEYLNGIEDIDQARIIEVNASKDGLNTAISNLFTNIDVACSDNIFTNTEITAIVSYFGKTNLAINECKNTIDYVFLGIGGFLIEEVSNITLRQDEISLEVKKIENDYVTSSEMTQTSDNIKMSFLQGGGVNKFHNSSFKNGTKYWSALSWASNGGSGGGHDFYVIEPPGTWCLSNRNVLCATANNLNKYTAEILGVGFDSEKIWGGTEWTLECLLACHRATDVFIEILEFDNNGTKLSSHQGRQVKVKEGGKDRRNWTKVNYQFTLQDSNCAYFICRFFMGAWTGEQTTAYMWLGEPMLVPGHHSELLYSPNADEVYEGITKIDMDGITVSNSNASTTTSMTADGFYINQNEQGDVFKVDSNGISLSQGVVYLDRNGLIIYSPNHDTNSYIRISDSVISSVVNGKTELTIDNGNIYFKDINDNAVGKIGRSTWKNTNIYLTSLSAEYGSTVSLSARYNPSDETYTAPLVVSSINQTVGSIYYKQGLNLTSPNIFGGIFLRNSDNISEYQGYIGYDSTGGALQLLANEMVCLGINRQDVSTRSLDVCYDSGQTNKSYIKIWAPTDFNNFSIYNARVQSSISTSSIEPYTTNSNEGNTQLIYATYTGTDGELRYTERTTQHTMEEWDWVNGVYSPLGVYYCYCEIPSFMQENIEEDYHVNISRINYGEYRIIEKNQWLFIVESKEEGFAFTYEIVGKRKDTMDTIPRQAWTVWEENE